VRLDDVTRERAPFGARHARTAVAVTATALLLSACGGDAGSPLSGTTTSSRTSTGEVVDLGGGTSIRYPGKAPKNAPAKPSKQPEQASATGRGAPPSWRAALAQALAAGRRDAESMDGSADAAIWADGWSAPITSGDATRRSRMWSMFKPIAVIAGLKAAGAAGRPGGSAETRAAMRLALRRSDNCAARRVVLSLQQLASGSDGAAARIRAVLEAAGSAADVATRTGPADAICRAYLRGSTVLRNPLAPGLQLGTSTWSVRDAVAFAHALGGDSYGSDGARVRQWMREPKDRSAQVPAAQYTVSSPEWGAGVALADRNPAFKGGWGGTQQDRFVVGQIATFDAGTVRLAMAVYFHPRVQPALDDPGQTAAPAALEAVFGRVDAALRKLTGG
jgi:hypothetical protein